MSGAESTRPAPDCAAAAPEPVKATETATLSVVIVHFNTEDLTRACIRSVLHECNGIPLELFLVDNGSTDGSGERLAAEFPGLELIRCEEGIGYGAANNLAARRARGRFLLFLNSDTEIHEGALLRMLDFMEQRPGCTLAGCRLLKADGSLDRACRRSFPTPSVSFYKLLGLNRIFPGSRRFARYDLRFMPVDGRYQVDSLVGAFLLFRRHQERNPGGFDEDYFFYGEDIDLCYRAKQAGGEVWYLGDITSLHRKGGTTNKRAPWVIFHFHRSMRIFYDKHYRSRYPLPVTVLVYAGIYLRMVVMQVLNVFKRGAPE